MPNSPEALTNEARNLAAKIAELRILDVVDLASQFGTGGFEPGYVEPTVAAFIQALQGTVHPSLAVLAEVINTHDPEQFDKGSREELEYNAKTAEMADFLGFGVRFANPVRDYRSHDKYQSNWTYFRTVWVYALSIDLAWKAGLEWAAANKEKDLKEAGFDSIQVAAGSLH